METEKAADLAEQKATHFGWGDGSVDPSALEATQTELIFDYSVPTWLMFLDNSNTGYWCLDGSLAGCGGLRSTDNIAINAFGSRIEYTAGEFAYAAEVSIGSAVPIPAAAWLFGSALAGLGWMRRKQTA